MSVNHREIIAEELVKSLELPDSAYEKAKKRYSDLGAWLEREESTLRQHSPHVLPQGSFRLGTAIRPIDEKSEYDLDLACKLRTGIAKSTHSQQQLKKLVGNELEKYRIARHIENT